MAILDKFRQPSALPMRAPSGVGSDLVAEMKKPAPPPGIALPVRAPSGVGAGIAAGMTTPAPMAGAAKPAMPGLGGTAQPAQIGSSNAMLMPPPKRPGAVQVATSPAATAASASLARPMQELRQDAYGKAGNEGPMPTTPARFGEARPLLGNTVFKNLQPRSPAGGSPRPSGNPMDSGGATQSSYAGFAPFLDEQTAGAPRRISGFRGRRAGARFTEGPMRGKTLDQAQMKSREKYAALSPEQKAAYESKARMEDISSEIPATGVDPASQVKPLPAPTPSWMSIDPAELGPIAPPRRRPGLPAIGAGRGGAQMPAEDWPD